MHFIHIEFWNIASFICFPLLTLQQYPCFISNIRMSYFISKKWSQPRLKINKMITQSNGLFLD